jgi:excisionase family DNA binding protein
VSILTLRAFARATHVDPATVRRWIHAGMPAWRDGARWRIPTTVAELWVAEQADQDPRNTEGR